MAASTLLGRRILVVEDEMMVAMLMEDILTELGCVVVGPAYRVVDALRLLAEVEIDAALLDVNLNGAESYPVAEELRRREVPFVFATGYGAAGIRPGCGQFATIQKPFEPMEVAEALRGALAAE